MIFLTSLRSILRNYEDFEEFRKVFKGRKDQQSFLLKRIVPIEQNNMDQISNKSKTLFIYLFSGQSRWLIDHRRSFNIKQIKSHCPIQRQYSQDEQIQMITGYQFEKFQNLQQEISILEKETISKYSWQYTMKDQGNQKNRQSKDKQKNDGSEQIYFQIFIKLFYCITEQPRFSFELLYYPLPISFILSDISPNFNIQSQQRAQYMKLSFFYNLPLNIIFLCHKNIPLNISILVNFMVKYIQGWMTLYHTNGNYFLKISNRYTYLYLYQAFEQLLIEPRIPLLYSYLQKPEIFGPYQQETNLDTIHAIERKEREEYEYEYQHSKLMDQYWIDSKNCYELYSNFFSNNYISKQEVIDSAKKQQIYYQLLRWQ
ncbi:hypothetical protein pb186bvf_000678 [Paramecium bursaria]